MASKFGVNRRKAEAQERLETVVPVLAGQLGLEIPDLPVFRRDADAEAAERMTWAADVLEQVSAAIASMATPAKKPATKKASE